MYVSVYFLMRPMLCCFGKVVCTGGVNSVFCVLFLIAGCVQVMQIVTVHGSNNDYVCRFVCPFFGFGPWAVVLGPIGSGFMFVTWG